MKSWKQIDIKKEGWRITTLLYRDWNWALVNSWPEGCECKVIGLTGMMIVQFETVTYQQCLTRLEQLP